MASVSTQAAAAIEAPLAYRVCLRCSKDIDRMLFCDRPRFQKCEHCDSTRHECLEIPHKFYKVLNHVMDYASEVALGTDPQYTRGELEELIARYTKAVEAHMRRTNNEGKATKVLSGEAQAALGVTQAIGSLEKVMQDIGSVLRASAGLPVLPTPNGQFMPEEILVHVHNNVRNTRVDPASPTARRTRNPRNARPQVTRLHPGSSLTQPDTSGNNNGNGGGNGGDNGGNNDGGSGAGGRRGGGDDGSGGGNGDNNGNGGGNGAGSRRGGGGGGDDGNDGNPPELSSLPSSPIRAPRRRPAVNYPEQAEGHQVTVDNSANPDVMMSTAVPDGETAEQRKKAKRARKAARKAEKKAAQEAARRAAVDNIDSP